MKLNMQGALIALMMLPFVWTGCASVDEPKAPAPDVELEPVHFNLRLSGMKNEPTTRALATGYKYGDGKSISVLKCYIYHQGDGNNAAPSKIEDIDIKTVNTNKGGDITLMLPKGELYDLVFLATSIPQTNSSSKLYYNSTDRTLSVNYNLVSANDEEMDCFFAVQKDVTTETVLENAIELTRPYAQLNIGAGDYSLYNLTTPVKNIGVSVDGIYNKISLMDGTPVGNPIKVTFPASAVPTGQTFPVADITYLSMNYLLVNLRKLVDVTVTVNHTNSSTAAKTIPVENVAVERNYQSNIYGKTLLTVYEP